MIILSIWDQKAQHFLSVGPRPLRPGGDGGGGWLLSSPESADETSSRPHLLHSRLRGQMGDPEFRGRPQAACTLAARQAEAVPVKRDSGEAWGSHPSPGEWCPHSESTGPLVSTQLDCGPL